MSGQLYASAALPLGKELPVPIRWVHNLKYISCNTFIFLCNFICVLNIEANITFGKYAGKHIFTLILTTELSGHILKSSSHVLYKLLCPPCILDSWVQAYLLPIIVCYLTTLSVAKLYSVEEYSDKWIGKLEGGGSGRIEIAFRHLPGGGWREPRRTSVRIVVVPAEIRTEHFPNTILEPYLCSGFRLSSCDFALCSPYLPTDVVRYFRA
jgi:hypothetical protein